jgi:hypothetical protein
MPIQENAAKGGSSAGVMGLKGVSAAAPKGAASTGAGAPPSQPGMSMSWQREAESVVPKPRAIQPKLGQQDTLGRHQEGSGGEGSASGARGVHRARAEGSGGEGSASGVSRLGVASASPSPAPPAAAAPEEERRLVAAPANPNPMMPPMMESEHRLACIGEMNSLWQAEYYSPLP